MNNRLYQCLFINKRPTTKKFPVYLRITIGGKRESIHTGVYTCPEEWDASKGRIKQTGEDYLTKNNLLMALQTRATEVYTELIKAKLPISSRAVRMKLTSPDMDQLSLLQLMEKHNGYIMRRVGNDVAKATQTKYKTLTRKIQTYMKLEYKRDDTLVNELNRAFLMGFELYLKSEEHIGHNTAIKYVQFLKRVINYGIAMEWFFTDPFKSYKCSIKPVIRDFLTQTEIDTIRTKEMPRASLDNIRNIFVFACYTGLAYADVRKLHWGEIVTGFDGNLWIRTNRAKTTTLVQVPLLPVATELLPAYSCDIKEGPVFYVPSNQKVNEALKDIVRICGITKRLSFHIARHSFATTITLSNGVPIETVSKMLGHTNIKTTQIYGKIVDHKISEDMNRLKYTLKEDSVKRADNKT